MERCLSSHYFFRLILQTMIYCPRHVLAGLLYRESVSDYVVEKQLKKVGNGWTLDILIRKISLDPIGLHGQGAIVNYMPKFQVATMSLEVA